MQRHSFDRHNEKVLVGFDPTPAGLQSVSEMEEKLLIIGNEKTGISPKWMLCFVLPDWLSCRHQ